MRNDEYLSRLRAVPALAHCSDRQLLELARLVDTIELPAGATIASNPREVLVVLEPTRVMVIERRALDAVNELAPALAATA